MVCATPGIEALYGYSPQLAVGQLVALVLPEQRRGHFGELLERIREGEEIPPYLALHRHLDGSDVPVEVSASPVIDASGAVSGAVVLLRDLRVGAAEAIGREDPVGQVVAGSGALAFQVDLETSPPTFWFAGDRSLAGLPGTSTGMRRAGPGELDEETAKRLLEMSVQSLEGGRCGSRVGELAAPDRPMRWLAVRSGIVEGDELSPRVLRGVALDLTDRYLGVGGVHQEVKEPTAFVVQIRLGEEPRLEYVSESASHFTGYGPDQLLEGGLPLLRRCLDPALLDRLREDARTGEIDGSSYEYRTFRRDGSSLWVRTSARILNGEDGRAPLLEAAAVDVTQAKLVELEVSRLALVDALTGLSTRKALEETWQELRTRPADGSTWMALACVDVDRFGLVNAGLGMAAGDEMLRLVGHRLRDLAGDEALVARMGADDFVVLAGSLPSQPAAIAMAGRLVGAGAEAMLIGGREVYGTVSVGATLRNGAALGPRASLDDHLAEAHVALRAAKAHNGGAAEIFAEGMRSQAQAKIETHTALRRGMDEGQFLLHYQPIVDLRSGCPVGAEALLRWEHPTRGLLLPSEFIELAEETGSIVELGGWVLEEACRSAASWPAGSLGELTVAVNLSARQLVSSDLLDRVTRALDRVGLPPERLVLEITETSVIYDLDGAGSTLRRLSDLGVHFALDDFGTGYSSLVYLVQLPIDRVKVDRSMVAALPHAAHSQAVLAAVVAMAEAMEIHAVAEGVETTEQIAVLDDLGCELAQGFYFSPPVTEERLLELVSTSPV